MSIEVGDVVAEYHTHTPFVLSEYDGVDVEGVAARVVLATQTGDDAKPEDAVVVVGASDDAALSHVAMTLAAGGDVSGDEFALAQVTDAGPCPVVAVRRDGPLSLPYAVAWTLDVLLPQYRGVTTIAWPDDD